MSLKECAEQARAEAVRLEGLTSSAKFDGGIAEVRGLHDLAGALKDFAKGAGKVQSAADAYREKMSEDVSSTIIRKADGFPIVLDILGIDPEPVLPGTEEAAMVGAGDQPPVGEQESTDEAKTDEPPAAEPKTEEPSTDEAKPGEGESAGDADGESPPQE